MATISESALPLCTNPQHPPSRPRRMEFLQYRDHAWVFGCQGCKDVNHKLSVRVMTDQFYKREVRKALAAQGRLLNAPPPMRRPQFAPMPPPSIGWDSTARRSKDGKYELVRYENLPNGDLRIQMAVDGKLAPQMDDHIASREEFRTEEAYWTRVARASELMLHLYGDPRHPLSPEESKRREGEAF